MPSPVTTLAPPAPGGGARQALHEIQLLLERGGSMEEFLSHFLNVIVAVCRARGGAIWGVQSNGIQMACHARYEETLYEAQDRQRESIDAVLADGVRHVRPLLLAPTDENGHHFEALGRRLVNLSRFPFLFVPASIAGRKGTPAIIHLWVAPETPAATLNEYVQFLQAAGEKLARFLETKRVESLETNSEALQQLYQLAAQLTGQFDAAKAGIFLANRGREIIGCDRLVVFIQRRGALRPLAVSNVEALNPRSSIIQTQALLVEEALAARKTTLYQKVSPKTEELGDISDYFFHSHTDEALALPLFGSKEQPVGGVLAEFADRKLTPAAQRLATAVAAQATKSLEGVLEIEALPLLGVMRKLGRGRDAIREQSRQRLLVRFGVPALIALVVIFFPMRLKVQSDCVVMPARQGFAVAEVPGRITKVLVQEGDVVKAGQVLATINDLELQQELQVADEEFRKAEAEANRLQARGDEASRRVALIEATRTAHKVEQIKLSLEKTNIRSPLDGTVTSKQIQNRIGEVVALGSRFCEISDLQKWEVWSKLKEADLGLLDAKLRQDGRATVGFALNSMPDRKFSATIENLAALGQASLSAQGSNVFVVRGIIDDPAATAALRTGYTGRSKIPLGWRPAGWLAVRKCVSYLKVRWLQ